MTFFAVGSSQGKKPSRGQRRRAAGELWYAPDAIGK